MGERGQILMKKSGVYLYTHWNGYSLKESLQRALKKKWRWDDEEYLTRIIFCEMVKDELMEETGFGIGTLEHVDLNHQLLIVDVKKQIIRVDEKEWTFKEFCKGVLK